MEAPGHYLYHGLPGHPSEGHQQQVLHLHVVLLVAGTVGAEITDFDMIAFTDQTVPEQQKIRGLSVEKIFRPFGLIFRDISDMIALANQAVSIKKIRRSV